MPCSAGPTEGGGGGGWGHMPPLPEETVSALKNFFRALYDIASI